MLKETQERDEHEFQKWMASTGLFERAFSTAFSAGRASQRIEDQVLIRALLEALRSHGRLPLGGFAFEPEYTRRKTDEALELANDAGYGSLV